MPHYPMDQIPTPSDATGTVTSVNGYTGIVTITPNSIGAASTAQGVKADTAIQLSDLSRVATSGNYTDLANKPVIPTVNYPVTSVSSRTGAVTLDSSDVGLGNVNNTSDANKPISTATQAALPIIRRIDNSLIASPIKIKYYSATSDISGIWTISLGSDFTEVLDVSVRAFSVDNTVAGIRQATLNSYIPTATSVSGVTFGNTLLNTALVTAGANSLSLVSSTIVKVSVTGIGS
jgi:hypothetical protein